MVTPSKQTYAVDVGVQRFEEHEETLGDVQGGKDDEDESWATEGKAAQKS